MPLPQDRQRFAVPIHRRVQVAQGAADQADVADGNGNLEVRVEVDETFIGGEEPGLSGGRAKGKKSLVAVAVEVHEPRGYGRVRMGIIADASAACLHPFITANVEPGGTVITDGWQGYSGIERVRLHP